MGWGGGREASGVEESEDGSALRGQQGGVRAVRGWLGASAPHHSTCLSPAWLSRSQSGPQAMDRGRPLRRSSKQT